MSGDRWARVKSLFQGAIERPPEERAAYLAVAAADDPELQREVESLLAADGGNVPTERLPLMGRDAPAGAFLPAGEHIGPYEVLAPIGAGGMGEVYRARDGKLHRDVALKVLPAAFAADPDRMARFKREAQVLAALNHPHIGGIYGLEESATRQALVLELVDGSTLADRIRAGRLPLREALEIARQIVAALAAAHQKSIVHRDLKPANIKVTPAGVVKVLDFGLAKTAATDGSVRASQAPTHAGDTRVGAVLGTAAYMSPEQARGLPVDARTDIWAFGCVLFEMLTGHKAFAADATTSSVTKILEREPEWRALPSSTPRMVRHLLRRCLEKDAARRPQTFAEIQTVIDRLVSRSGRHQRWITGGVAAAAAVGFGLYLWSAREQRSTVDRNAWIQLTNLDSATQPALSPDGRTLAFVRGPNTFVSPGQIYLKLLPDGEPTAISNDGLPKMGPVFSPDGTRIAYTVNDGDSWDTFEVPVLRGSPRRWLRNASGLVWLSQRELLFSEIKTGIHMGIVRSTDSRGSSRDVYFPPHQAAMAHRSYASPDGQWLLVVEMDQFSIWIPCRLLKMDGSSSRQVGPAPARCTNAAWSPDGQWMYLTADAGDGFHAWRQRFPDGLPEQLTAGPTEEEGLAVAPDGRSLVTSVGLSQRSVWLHDERGERQISLEGYAFSPLLSADGRKLLYRVTRSGGGSGASPSELHVADLATGESRRLYPGQLVTGYDLSADDRVIASVVQADGARVLWIGWLDDREPPRRIPGGNGELPRFGRRGDVVFTASEGDRLYIERMGEDGSGRRRLGEAGGRVLGAVSPDGEWVTGISSDRGYMVLFSLSGRAPVRVFPYSQSTRLRWSPDGSRLYFSIQYGQASAFGTGRTYALPLVSDTALPEIPAGGFRNEAEIASLPNVEMVPYGDVGPGPTSSTYTFSKITTTRNLYRIPLP